MKQMNRIIAGLTALCMGFLCLPVNNMTPVKSASIQAVAESKVVGGKCGANITWELNLDSGLFTVLGTGPMYRYPVEGPKWTRYRDSIHSLYVGDGVTTIGDAAFKGLPYGLPYLSAVRLPSTLTTIGESAFQYCSGLTDIKIPDSVENIGKSAFSGCTGLTTLYLPDSVSRIDDYAFTNCTRLQTLRLPQGLRTTGYSTFAGCAELDTIVIPKSMIALSNNMFSGCTGLRTVIFEDGIVSMSLSPSNAGGAFYNCPALTEVYIPPSVTSLTGYFDSAARELMTICGMKDSYAEEYANSHNIKFRALDAYPVPDEPEPPTEPDIPTEPPTDPPTEEPTEPPTQEPTEPTTEEPTEPPTQEPTEPPAEDTGMFRFYRDNWSFLNSRTNFTDGYYYLSAADYERLFSAMSATERERAQKMMDSKWAGSCYGMACTSILAASKVYEPSAIVTGAQSLYSIPGPPADNVRSFINFYLLQQKTDVIQQMIMDELYRVEIDKIRDLLSDMASGKPELITFFYNAGGGHAVVGTGLEDGEWIYNGTKYTTRVLIYDNNSVDLVDAACLYLDPSAGAWYIPCYNLGNTNGSLCICTNDLTDINLISYFDASLNSTACEWQYSILECSQVTGSIQVQKIRKDGEITFTGEDEIRQFSDLSEYGDGGDRMYALPDADSGYQITVSEPQALYTCLSYQDSMLTADVSSGAEMRFLPDNRLSVKGRDMDYAVSIVLDSPQAYGFTWDSLAIRGTHADEVKLELTDSGFVLEASDLSRITAIAESNMEENGLIFSAPVQKALIYEKEDASIGVSFDLDNDGTYETPLGAVPPEITETVGSGDVDGSGEVNILDVIAVNKYIIGVKTLSADQLTAADVDGNGEVNSTDSMLILKYALDMITAFPKK